MRPAEVDLLVGDSTKARTDAGLEPQVGLRGPGDDDGRAPTWTCSTAGCAGSPDPVTAVAVVAGGVGAARMLGGLVQVVDPASITAVVNTGDDVELHGLHISPDLDTITYTLAGAINPETGWGLAGETWQAMEALGRYGGVTWFNLGDRDLGTHLYRTAAAAGGRHPDRGHRRDRRRLGPRPARCCP